MAPYRKGVALMVTLTCKVALSLEKPSSLGLMVECEKYSFQGLIKRVIDGEFSIQLNE